jgi:hypothetical protein
MGRERIPTFPSIYTSGGRPEAYITAGMEEVKKKNRGNRSFCYGGRGVFLAGSGGGQASGV